MKQTGIIRETGGGRLDWLPLIGSVVENITTDAPKDRYIHAELDGTTMVSWSRADGYGERYINVGLIHAVSKPEDATDSLLDSLAVHAKDIERIYSYTYHRRIHVTPYVVVDPDQPRGLTYNPTAVKEQIEYFDEHTHWIIRGGYKAGIDGEAYLNTTKAAWYSGPVSVAVHELGHALGEGHSNANGIEYRDPWCWMGGRNRSGLNPHHAYNQEILGRYKTISGTGGANLVPSDTHDSDIRDGEHAALLIDQGDGAYMWLCTRLTGSQSPVGVFRPLGTVYVHSPIGSMDSSTTTYLGFISPGESGNYRGYRISNYGDGLVTKVSVNGGMPDSIQDQEINPFSIIDERCNKIWHDPRYKYQGFDIHIKGRNAIGYWFTHKVDGGRTWRVLDGTLEGGVWTFDILSTEGRKSKKDGEGWMWMTAPNRARLNYRCNSWGIGHFNMRPITPVRDNGDGIYKSGDFEGFSVSDFGARRVAYRYYYNGNNPTWGVYDGAASDMQIYWPESEFRWYYGELKEGDRTTFGPDHIGGIEVQKLEMPED